MAPEISSALNTVEKLPPSSKDISASASDATKKANATDIANILSTLSHQTAEHTEINFRPELNTKISLPSPLDTKETFAAQVTEVKKNGDQVEIIVQAGDDYPQGKNRTLTFTAKEFADKFKGQIEENARFETVMNTITDTIIKPALSGGEISETKRGEMSQNAAKLLSDASLKRFIDDTTVELSDIIDEHNNSIKPVKEDTSTNSLAPKNIEAVKRTSTEKKVEEKIQINTNPLTKAQKENQNFETEVDAIGVELNRLLKDAGENSSVPVSENVLSSAVDKLKAIKGMNPEIFDLMNKGLRQRFEETNATINRRNELMGDIATIDNQLNPYLAQADKLIGTDTLKQLATAILAIKNLNDEKKARLSEHVAKKIEAHNQSIKKFDNDIRPIDEFAQKLLGDLSRQNTVRSETIDVEKFHNQLIEALTKAAIKPDSAQAQKWLKEKEETVIQINRGIEEQNRVENLEHECNHAIDVALQDSEKTSDAVITDLQEKANTLPDKEKTELSQRITELKAHNVHIAQAEELVKEAIESTQMIDYLELDGQLGNLIPTAIDQFRKRLHLEDGIRKHNKSLEVRPPPLPTDVTPIDEGNQTAQDQPTIITPVADAPELTASPSTYAPQGQRTEVFGTPIAASPEALAAEPISTAIPVPDAKTPEVTSTIEQPTVRFTPAAEVLSSTPQTKETSREYIKANPDIAQRVQKLHSLLEQNNLLSETEKVRILARATEMMQSASKDTNVTIELEKVIAESPVNRELLRTLTEQSDSLAVQIQTAVQAALDTNSTDYAPTNQKWNETLASLPTVQARTALQAIYNAAIENKKLRNNFKAIQAQVEKALADLADKTTRKEDLKPLLDQIAREVKDHIRTQNATSPEAQVLGSQNAGPSEEEWARLKTVDQPANNDTKTEQTAGSLSYRLGKKIGSLLDRIRGKKTKTTETEDEVASQPDMVPEASIDLPQTQEDLVRSLIGKNPDLTNEEKYRLEAKTLELLEKSNDINKTITSLREALKDRDEINRKISALVLQAPDMANRMSYTLNMALSLYVSTEETQEAVKKWQKYVDTLPTERAKQVARAIYQEALDNKSLRNNSQALENRIINDLASTGMVKVRQDAVSDLINTLATEINKAIAARKSLAETKPAEGAKPTPAPRTTNEVVSSGPAKVPEQAAQPLEQSQNTDKVEAVSDEEAMKTLGFKTESDIYTNNGAHLKVTAIMKRGKDILVSLRPHDTPKNSQNVQQFVSAQEVKGMMIDKELFEKRASLLSDAGKDLEKQIAQDQAPSVETFIKKLDSLQLPPVVSQSIRVNLETMLQSTKKEWAKNNTAKLETEKARFKLDVESKVRITVNGKEYDAQIENIYRRNGVVKAVVELLDENQHAVSSNTFELSELDKNIKNTLSQKTPEQIAA